MKTYFFLLLESHLYLLVLIIFIYIIELLSGKLLLIRWFKYKKDLKTAIGTADLEAILYFLYNSVFLILKIHLFNADINVSIITWLIIILPLSILVRKMYFKYQGIDRNKPDWEGKL